MTRKRKTERAAMADGKRRGLEEAGVMVLLATAVAACDACDHAPSTRAGAATSTAATTAVSAPVAPASASEASPVLVRRRIERPGVTARFPHDVGAFTQGLVFSGGELLESTGQYGESTLRRVELRTGKVLQSAALARDVFGEGLALLGGELFQLTWEDQRCFVYDAATFARKREMPYEGEGWGLATDGQLLIMSNGSAKLRFRDPRTFHVERTIEVTDQGEPLRELNELEWVRGEILANVWHSDAIARIDPKTGTVLGYLDLTSLPEPKRGGNVDDVLNGIAFDETRGKLLVTGKRWSTVFELAWP